MGLVGSREEVSPIGHFRYIWAVPDPVHSYSPFSIPTSAWIVEQPCSNAIVFNTDRRTKTKVTSEKQISNYKQQYFSFQLSENINKYFDNAHNGGSRRQYS